MVLPLWFTLYAKIQVQTIFYNLLYIRGSAKTYFASYTVRAPIYTVVRLAAIIN